MEIWKDIRGLEGYYKISNLGRVKSLDRVSNNRTYKGKVLKTKPGTHGYVQLNLCKDNIRYRLSIHRLVAEHFVSKIKGKEEVNHKNGIKHDNRSENLEWVSRIENLNHAVLTGLTNIKGKNHPRAKSVINCRGEVFDTIREAAAKYKVKHSHISSVCKGVYGYKTSGTYSDGTRVKWAYVKYEVLNGVR